jgi:hypothetical protein
MIIEEIHIFLSERFMANEDKRKGFPFVKTVKGESVLLATVISAEIII